ncbi:MAG: phosphonoacetaldehyde reductase [bacterium]|nr:phosphonoacetaldehyde reductase [bacterium]
MDNLNQVEFVYRGAIENLSKIVGEEKAKKVLVFTGKKSFESIKPQIVNELRNCECVYYNDFETNPKEEDVKRAISTINNKFDIIIAIGGGSVIDFAKAFRYYAKSTKKLVAIPTTCGTGSESTQFAVIYIDGIKHSLDERSILPEYAIVDSQFVDNNPKYLKACTSMDAFCQGIESFWAVKSTELSREYAKQAIELCRDNIEEYVNSNNKNASDNMALASHLAGKAINISRTTASHALSYAITSKYGLPHGHAVALTIGELFRINFEKADSELKLLLSDLGNIISDDVESYFKDLFSKINLKTTIENFDKEYIISGVNLDRLSNNPIKLSSADLMQILSGIEERVQCVI